MNSKNILAIIGMVIGQLIGGLIADSRAIDWTIGLILGTAGYLFPGFIRYTRSSPKQLLSFHGPDAPISRATSSGELRAFLSQLHKGGLLLDFNPQKSDAKVDRSQWGNPGNPYREIRKSVPGTQGTRCCPTCPRGTRYLFVPFPRYLFQCFSQTWKTSRGHYVWMAN